MKIHRGMKVLLCSALLIGCFSIRCCFFRPGSGSPAEKTIVAGLVKIVRSGSLDGLCKYFQSFPHAAPAFVNEPDSDGEPPLHWACMIGRADIVRFLLEHGADANCRDNDNDTPLHSAAINGSAEVVNVLFEYGALSTINAVDNHGYTALHSAAFHDNADVIQQILDAGGHESLSCVAKNGLTPLGAALYNGHEAGAGALLRAYGAKV